MIAVHCCSSYFLSFIFTTIGFVLMGSPVIPFLSQFLFLPWLLRSHPKEVQCPLDDATHVQKTSFGFYRQILYPSKI